MERKKNRVGRLSLVILLIAMSSSCSGSDDGGVPDSGSDGGSADTDADGDADTDSETDTGFDYKCFWQHMDMEEDQFNVHLSDIWGTSLSDIWAVGRKYQMYDHSVVCHWDGTQWEYQIIDAGSSLCRMFAVNQDDIFAVGGKKESAYPEGYVVHYFNGEWNEISDGIPSSDGNYSIWGTSSDNLYIAGRWFEIGQENGPIVHFDGEEWSILSLPTSNMAMKYIDGSSENDIFVAGFEGEMAHFDGESWAAMETGASEDFGDIWVDDSGEVFAIVYDSQVLHYDGVEWSQTDGLPAPLGLYDIWGTSPQNVYAVGQKTIDGTGEGQMGIILHYDGMEWRIEYLEENTLPQWCYLSGIWGLDEKDVFAVGTGGTVLHGVCE